MKRTIGYGLQAAGLLGLFLFGGAACGKRGNPLPPLRPMPARVADAEARRVSDRVELRFTIPATNMDNSTPPAITRLDIYAAAGPATIGALPSIPVVVFAPPIPTSKPISLSRFPAMSVAAAPVEAIGKKGALLPPTTAAQLLRPQFLRGHIDVKPPPPPDSNTNKNAEASAPAAVPGPDTDGRPAAGEVTTFVEDVAKERAATSADAAVLRYIVVPVAGRTRFGTPSAVLEVPLRVAVASPPPPVLTYDEHTLTLAWTSTSPGERFRVYRSDPAGKEQTPALTVAPLAASVYTTPVEFGEERCFIVRTVVSAVRVSVESEASPPVCTKPVDTFPPAAPTRLVEQPYEGKISLGWGAVDAPDLAGYLVLRAEGNDVTMRAVTEAPVSDPSFVDTTTRPGVRYTYAVLAVDKAGNRSPESNRVIEVGR